MCFLSFPDDEAQIRSGKVEGRGKAYRDHFAFVCFDCSSHYELLSLPLIPMEFNHFRME